MKANGDVPAFISEDDWTRHSAELARVSGLVSTLVRKLDLVGTNLAACASQMKTLATRVESLDRTLRERDRRLDKLDEWKEDTGRYELAKLEKELAEQLAEKRRRFWFVVKVVGTVVAAVAEAAVLHFLHWGAP